jgi:UDP-GlcNAc3NAcA epimerase
VKRVLIVFGTRPQFIKLAALAPLLPGRLDAIVVDTGQHYDRDLAGQFLSELEIAEPDVVLDAERSGGLPQIADILLKLEQTITASEPDAVICIGDTNSTLAAGLTAVKLNVPLIHIEAGERSFRGDGSRIAPWTVPEETNRLLTDAISSLLLCASVRATRNLSSEKVRGESVHTGDLMLDLYIRNLDRALDECSVLAELGLESRGYYFCTVHRAINTDDPIRLKAIVGSLTRMDLPVLLSLHPRTRAVLESHDLLGRLAGDSGITVLPPLCYRDSIALSHEAHCVLTDSGGVTREAFFGGVRSVILDDTTAWLDIVESGWSVLAGANACAIGEGVAQAAPFHMPQIFGDGCAADRTVAAILEFLSQ